MRIVGLEREAKTEYITVREEPIAFKRSPTLVLLTGILSPFRKKTSFNDNP
jgi:hypothetical protein